jgi:hypothetical protein
VAFVQPPVAFDRDPHQIHFLQYDPRGAYRPLQDGGEHEVKAVTALLQHASGASGFFLSSSRKIDVRPAGEAIFPIPDTFAVRELREQEDTYVLEIQ